MRRIVITGLGMVTPLGNGVATSWKRLIEGVSGIGPTTRCDVSDMSCRIAGEVARGDGPGEFNPDSVVLPKDQRKIDDFILYAIAAAVEAVEDSGWMPEDEPARERTGVIIGSGIGGLDAIAKQALLIHERGPRRVTPFFIPSALINLAAGHVSIRYGFKGPNHAVVTACSTGAHAIGDAARMIEHGDAEVMVAGGTEAAVCRLGIAGFAAARALSTHFNDQPTRASRPWDKDRDGFVMGEGAGVVVVEELEHARARGAKIYAELIGYGMSGDAHHITAPAEDGSGAFRSMRAALASAGLDPSDIDYINAHGTSTPLGDEIELHRQAPVRQRGLQALDVLDQVLDRPSPGRRRQRRGDLLHPRHPARNRAADPQSRQSVGRLRYRPRRPSRKGADGALRALQLLRLRRHQRIADLRPGTLTAGDAARRSPRGPSFSACRHAGRARARRVAA